MRNIRIQTLNNNAVDNDLELPAGNFAGVMLNYWGDAADAVTVALADFGTLIHRFRSKATMNWRVAEAWTYTHLRGGRPAAVSNASGAYQFTVILPYRYGPLNTYNSDDNLMQIRDHEARLYIPGIATALVDSAYVDVCMLEDTGAARYIPQIFSQLIDYTGADRVRPGVANLRHFLLQQAQGGGGVSPTSILLTRDGKVLVEGNWLQLEALTDVDSMVELGAADTGYIMPDLGHDNPATWAGGRYELHLTGASSDSTAYFVEFGAEPVSVAEHNAVNIIESGKIAEGKTTSPLPPPADTAPIENRKVFDLTASPTAVAVGPNREQAQQAQVLTVVAPNMAVQAPRRPSPPIRRVTRRLRAR